MPCHIYRTRFAELYYIAIVTVFLCVSFDNNLQIAAEHTLRVFCGDGICTSPQENIGNCNVDCSARCGDGICTISHENMYFLVQQ